MKSSFGSFLNEATLELSQGGENVENQFAGAGGRVYSALVQRTESNARPAKIFDQRNQVPHASSETIESPSSAEDNAGE